MDHQEHREGGGGAVDARWASRPSFQSREATPRGTQRERDALGTTPEPIDEPLTRPIPESIDEPLTRHFEWREEQAERVVTGDDTTVRDHEAPTDVSWFEGQPDDEPAAFLIDVAADADPRPAPSRQDADRRDDPHAEDEPAPFLIDVAADADPRPTPSREDAHRRDDAYDEPTPFLVDVDDEPDVGDEPAPFLVDVGEPTEEQPATFRFVIAEQDGAAVADALDDSPDAFRYVADDESDGDRRPTGPEPEGDGPWVFTVAADPAAEPPRRTGAPRSPALPELMAERAADDLGSLLDELIPGGEHGTVMTRPRVEARSHHGPAGADPDDAAPDLGGAADQDDAPLAELDPVTLAALDELGGFEDLDLPGHDDDAEDGATPGSPRDLPLPAGPSAGLNAVSAPGRDLVNFTARGGSARRGRLFG